MRRKKQWDIYTWEFPAGKHPALVGSHPARLAVKPTVNILRCSSQRARRAAEVNEVTLDGAAGLDWAARCECDLLYDVPKADLTGLRGSVSPIRRRRIVERIVSSFGCSAV